MLETLKARKEALEAQGKKGFTLMEMLIVIAIIAILIAIAIPIFTAQLERAREATDAANLRSAYAEVTASYLSDNKAVSTTVDMQSDPNDFVSDASMEIAGVPAGDVLKGFTNKKVTVEIDDKGVVKIGGKTVPSNTLSSAASATTTTTTTG